MPLNLGAIRAALFDMDGVLYRGVQPLPGVNALLAFLEQQGIAYACITNNATLTPEQFAAKVQAMGLQIPASRIMTSSVATNVYLRSVAPRGTTVYAVGMGGLTQPLFGDGYFVSEERAPAFVVVGADFEVTYAARERPLSELILIKPFRPRTASFPAAARCWRRLKRRPIANRRLSESRSRACLRRRWRCWKRQPKQRW
jgi:ribonucleotide monophosphatase NagD (HAD superfamily)